MTVEQLAEDLVAAEQRQALALERLADALEVIVQAILDRRDQQQPPPGVSSEGADR